MTPNSTIRIQEIEISNSRPFTLIAGPCQLESRAHGLEMAAALKEICGKLGVPLIFKTSFDKANRSSLASQRGLGFPIRSNFC